jgi:hypothetical protein
VAGVIGLLTSPPAPGENAFAPSTRPADRPAATAIVAALRAGQQFAP